MLYAVSADPLFLQHSNTHAHAHAHTQTHGRIQTHMGTHTCTHRQENRKSDKGIRILRCTSTHIHTCIRTDSSTNKRTKSWWQLASHTTSTKLYISLLGVAQQTRQQHTATNHTMSLNARPVSMRHNTQYMAGQRTDTRDKGMSGGFAKWSANHAHRSAVSVHSLLGAADQCPPPPPTLNCTCKQ